MTDSAKKPADRKARLSEALRANLKRRKAQAREKCREGDGEAELPPNEKVKKDPD